MNRMSHALRTWFRESERARRVPQPPSLTVEILEDRVTPAGDFRSVIGLDALQNLYSYRGTGYTVAVLDTGIDYNHADLGGGFGAGHRVIAGYDFINNDADPMDDNGHGTHLAGIIGSSNPNSIGIAPNVQFVALKVLDANKNGNWTAIDKALQWVSQHQAEYNIVAVNLSLGSGNYTTNAYTFLDDDFATLKSQGVFTAVAAGNSYYSFNSQLGLSFPAVSPNVVSVGATWAGDFGKATFATGAIDYTTAQDQIASFTQRSSELSILAPGAWINSTWLKGSYQTMGGTSMSTAVVTGAAVLLHQAYDQTGNSSLATQDNILRLMKSTGVTTVDSQANNNVKASGLTFKRLDVKAAMDVIGKTNTPPTLAAIANQTMQVGQTITVPLSAMDADRDPVNLSARIVYLPALAYQLKQQHGFTSSGNYYTNGNGANEKWIYSNTYKAWYWLMPNGDLQRWTGSTADTLLAINRIATLDPSYYADPRMLWNAATATSPPANVTINGTQLVVQATAPWSGTYTIEVSASDGYHKVSRTFTVSMVNSPPTLSEIPPQTLAKNQASLTLSLGAGDADRDTLTFQAGVRTPDATAYRIQQQYGLRQFSASYFTNLWGRREKWLIGNNNQWYALLPDGRLYRWKNSITETLRPANLIAMLGGWFYSEPRLLWEAKPPVTPALTLSLQGNQLRIQRPAGLTGIFYIDIIVNDGLATTKRTIQVTLN